MSRAKELFLARMSHELRTPISGILGIAQLAHYKDTNVQADFKKIRSQAEYLQSLVNDVLDMAASDNDKFTLHTGKFSLNAIISEVSDLFYSQCRQKKIKFNFRVDNVTHEYLIGDEVRIKQVLVNLLSNAFKKKAQPGKCYLEIQGRRINRGSLLDCRERFYATQIHRREPLRFDTII